MDQLFARIPTRILAILILALGLVFIVAYDPPKDICDIQIEILARQHSGVLSGKKKNEIETSAKILDLIANCKNSGTPGGCSKLFNFLNLYIVDFRHVPDKCMDRLSENTILTDVLFHAFELMIKIAWQESHRGAISDSRGWFDSADLSLFCRLKAEVRRIKGNDSWMQYQEEQLTELKSLAGLKTREQVWQASILSTPCNNYL